MSKLSFRSASRQDIPEILQFIKELAAYEKMSEEVTATEELLEHWLFEQNIGEVLFAEYDNALAGFALFFHNFSTFVGKAGLYLEDIYIRPAYRGKGIGNAFMETLAELAVQRGCGRMEWVCLDWNKPSIDFYYTLGAKPMSEWTVYRLNQTAVNALAEKGTKPTEE